MLQPYRILRLGNACICGLIGAALCAAAAGLAQDAAERQSAVMMQRFVVAATRIEKNPWSYAALPGFEILSRGSEHDTDWWIDALRRGLWMENKLMPADWLPPPNIPYTVIIDDTDLAAVPSSQLHTMPVVLHRPVDALTWGDLSEGTSLATERIGSFDSDTLALNSNLYGINTSDLHYGSISLERLSRCAPPLPRWLVAGLVGRTSGVFREGFDLIPDPYDDSKRVDLAAGPGMLWVSLAETKRVLMLKKENGHNDGIALMPLRVLFAEGSPTEEDSALWESEAALFVRWGLFGPDSFDPNLPKEFREFVRRARIEPVTEPMFKECFGSGYDSVQSRLQLYLRKVIAEPTHVSWDMPSTLLEPVHLNEATPDQIGRILGDWLRMKGDSVRETNTELSHEFLAAAGRMLERAYRNDNGLPPDVDPSRGGERSSDSAENAGYGAAVAMKPFFVAADRIHDPRLLAVYGLYEHDVGNDDQARTLLEAAVKAKATRPRAYAVLAELRYAEAQGAPMGADGKLSAAQARSVLDPLVTVLQHGPTPDIYSLILATWNHCEAKPGPGDIDALAGGVTLYPGDTELAYNAALLCSQSGYPARAGALIDQGLVFATHQVNRDYFEQLRSTLGLPESK